MMPRFDGSGPEGKGPFSGRGEGYCAESDAGRGYAGLQGISIIGAFFRGGRRGGRVVGRLGRQMRRGLGRGGRRRRF